MSPPTLQFDESILVSRDFLEFLSTVQCSNGPDKEKIDFVKKLVRAVYNVKQSMEEKTHVSLYNLFDLDSEETTEQNERTSKTPNIARMTRSHSIGSATDIGLSLVNLFREFHMAVAAIGFFDTSIGEDYLKRKSRIKQIFKDAIGVLKRSGHQTFNRMNLADGLKMLGNNAMHLKMYDKAIVMYSCALALCKDNAIYFSNRAAAFTKIGKLDEAIFDCREAIKLDSRYAMALYRLGYAYYEQGNNIAAIREGFIKVLKLEPHNATAKVALKLATSKIKHELVQVREQIKRLKGNGSVTQEASRQSKVSVIQGQKEGGNGTIEETGEASDDLDEDTTNVAGLIEINVHPTPPPE